MLSSEAITAARSKASTIWPLERWDNEFKSHSRYGCLCVRLFCVVVCVGSGLATSLSLVQGVCVKKDYETEEEARPSKGL
jgi:hypothetical protein